MASKRKHSSLWLHFAEDGPLKAKCKYCKKSLSIAGGSNGNLSRHMKVKHPLTSLVQERQTPPEQPANLDVALVVPELPSSSSHVGNPQQKHYTEHPQATIHS